ncbi:protein odr-4 homolog isoform X1 [Carcharodon carcharias]|uniref:protein odr-4 homolog isoform X1 n=1 Tax=Carcharodon carcharias TaxID=13397 RepID=UPI001B7F1AC3|nr:protein odr-4 homolog isoform X1 [Carcharodon carcharias]XP_041064727.1 protein odr-4 homolog isoform X1 [Carcharodon carcharias]XP_041064728.1 protein odr-4 homolog isoform X1 [Carcharodon carcharias]XP_041064729.1 protein odr-4 homolog isoform X1 [Carcharodon carcharias]XP_041064730.1 protein odr-4 homolog isoform X1 [Carcharodon carcharias]XP_041064732.1 protein odr-4 homolog isoform X1 [Carcharodon carcharias]XP_041064733.1 protein odr-4 homolog isoform X1 [Carcharodon carcharias]XP_0
MGRSYVIGEYSEKYLKKLKAEERYGTTGILLGQITPVKTYIVFAARTPLKDHAELPPENPNEMNANDIEWVSEHARQVSRMLPGGILVLGVFLIRPSKMTKEEAHDIFRKLATAVEAAVTKERLWSFTEEEPAERVVLQVYADSKKMKVRAYDLHNPQTPIKMLDCKPSSLTAPWQIMEATINVDVNIPVPVAAEHKFDKDSLKGLNSWAKQIMHSSYLINGQFKEPENLIGEGSKKKLPVEVQFLTAPVPIADGEVDALIEDCGSSVTVKGTVRCRAYLHGSKSKVKDAIQSLKRDVLNTVFIRCQMVFEDQILNKNVDGDSSSLKAPHRVFAPVLPSGVAFCDYGFSDEGNKELEEHFKELLDYELNPAQLDRTEEVMLEEMGTEGIQDLLKKPEEQEIIETGFKYKDTQELPSAQPQQPVEPEEEKELEHSTDETAPSFDMTFAASCPDTSAERILEAIVELAHGVAAAAGVGVIAVAVSVIYFGNFIGESA